MGKLEGSGESTVSREVIVMKTWIKKEYTVPMGRKRSVLPKGICGFHAVPVKHQQVFHGT